MQTSEMPLIAFCSMKLNCVTFFSPSCKIYEWEDRWVSGRKNTQTYKCNNPRTLNTHSQEDIFTSEVWTPSFLAGAAHLGELSRGLSPRGVVPPLLSPSPNDEASSSSGQGKGVSDLNESLGEGNTALGSTCCQKGQRLIGWPLELTARCQACMGCQRRWEMLVKQKTQNKRKKGVQLSVFTDISLPPFSMARKQIKKETNKYRNKQTA